MSVYYITNQDGTIELNSASNRFYGTPRVKIITQSNVEKVLSGAIDSTFQYFIDGEVDLTGLDLSFTIPSTGLSLNGFGFDISKLICSDDDYTLFTGDQCGTFQFKGISFYITGSNSKVMDLTDATGTNAVEFLDCNFYGCTSLGELTDFRQYLELNIARFGGTPELTFSGTWNGARISTSIVRGLSDITALFKAGTGLTMSGRFITDINCDLPTNGALIDFSPANIVNDESLLLKSAFITRNSVIDASDTDIYPNIDHTSVKSYWSDNTGLPNTNKYLKTVVTTEVATTVSLADTYYPLSGTQTIVNSSHIDMPTNGQFRFISGSGDYQIICEIIIVGTANDEIDLRVTKSTDDGSTFPTEINHIKRIINNLSGARDVAFFPINFIATGINKNDRIRIEVENKSGARNVTLELDSYVIITDI